MTAPLLIVGLLAGFASALLFVSAAKGTALAALLFYVAPLPLFVAGLGFGILPLCLAGIVAALAVGLILNGWLAGVFAAAVAVPALVLVRLSFLGRPVDRHRAEAGLEWYPPGRIVLWAAALGALIVCATVFIAGGSAQVYRAELAGALAAFLETDQGKAIVPEGMETARLAEILAFAFPPVLAAMWTAILLANLWLGVKVAALSGRFRRPWPRFGELEFPRSAAFAFAVSVAASFVPGLAGLLGSLFAASLFVAYVLLGLAGIHRRTEGSGNRIVILTAVYLALIVFSWPALFLAGLGFADNAFGRRAGGTPLPPSP